MKSNCFYLQPNYPHPRTAIEAEILFAAHIMHLRFLKRPSGKTPREQNSSGEKIGAVWCSGADRRSFEASAVLHFVFFGVMVNKMQQSAKRKVFLKKNTLPEVFPLTAILAGSGKTMPFEKRRSRYKETVENKAEAYRVYVEHLFSACDAVDARIFSKGEMDEETGLYYYGARYLDPKYSRWLSGDPALSDYIPKAPIDDEAKKHNEKLPGMGGVFNVVNLHLYHYAGNNPVKYTDPDGKVSTETEVTLRIDGTLGKTNARDMAVILYQYSKNPNEGALSSIVTSAVGFFGSKPGIASALVSLVLALSSDEKNKINDFAFSIMNAVADYGEFLDSGDCSIHVTGDITTNNTIEFFRRKDEVLSKSTILSSNLNFALVDQNGKEIKHLGKYTADPSVIQKLLDNYTEKPIKVIEFYNGVPIKIKSFE